MTKTLQPILDNLPKSAGIYKMKDEEGRVLYVGKAKNLRNRVRSYFQKSKDHSIRTKKMVSQIADIEYIVVDSELEALILETNLIKELRPKYNILMKDDKNYCYIKVTTNEDFPRITIVRQIEKDHAKYFGPKTSSQRAQQTLKALKKIFPYRHCSIDIDFKPSVKVDPENKLTIKNRVECRNVSINIPCLDYHIKRCVGPCIGIPTLEEYQEIIDQVLRFLEGKTDKVIEQIKQQMIQAATDHKFELAARLRDKLLVVDSIIEKQKISDPNQKNTDIINFVTQDFKAYFNIFLIRDGKLIDQETFIIELPEDEDSPETILQSFLQQYYEKAADIGKEILIPTEIEDQEIFEDFLTQIKGQKVKIIIPQKGKKNKLLELAHKNASIFAKRHQISWQSQTPPPKELIEELQKYLKLPKKPQRIECYDISHFGGKNTVASMIVFENAHPKSKDYRQFRIQTIPKDKPDDYLSLAETLSRRLQYLSTQSTLPKDITFAKAKKSDLEQIQKIIKTADISNFFLLKNPEIIAIATISNHGTIEEPLEEIQPLWTNQESVDQQLKIQFLKLLIKKTKTSRIYIKTDPTNETFYTNLSFRVIYKIPAEIEITVQPDQICLVFDKKQGTDHSFSKKPDLILIDGGKGQLNVVYEIVKQLQLEKTISIASIAKREEEIFIPNLKTPLPLDKETPASRLLQQCRDEAHRFANEYRKKLQSRDLKSSILDTIEGVGPKIRQKLLKKFGSLDGIKAAPLKDLAKICGPKLAEKIREATT